MKRAALVVLLSAVAGVGLLRVHAFAKPQVVPAEGLDPRPSQGAGAPAPAAVSGDAARGKLIFQKRCTGCHALNENREGPALAGVFGRKAGTVAGFDYSPGLKNSGIAWNDATLEKWLSAPDLVVPDTNMDFRVPKAQERADLIAWFKQSKPLAP